MISDSSGQRAHQTRASLEDFIRRLLEKSGYDYVHPQQFQAARCLEQPIFSTKYPAGKDLYGKDHKCDFILYHPVRYPSALIIESKWQQSSGSVDEKFPFLVSTIKKIRLDAIVVLDGSGYSESAECWLRQQAGKDGLLHVFNKKEMMDFYSNGRL